MAHSERLYNMISNLWDTTYIINNGLVLHHVEGQKERSANEHREILEAVSNGNQDTHPILCRKH